MAYLSLNLCARAHGRSAADCACRMPDGWRDCPPEARGEAGLGIALRTAAPRHQAPISGADQFTGDACIDCGSLRMQRAGTCSVCLDCGGSGGCG
jgi:hypothetical protein